MLTSGGYIEDMTTQQPATKCVVCDERPGISIDEYGRSFCLDCGEKMRAGVEKMNARIASIAAKTAAGETDLDWRTVEEAYEQNLED